MNVKIDLVHQFYRVANEVALDPYTVSYCIRRIRSEGIRFLTVTLPMLSRAVLRSLEVGKLVRTDLTCFAWKSGSLRYFRSFLNDIFGSDGRLLPQPCPYALKRLRTLCDYWYKLEYPVAEKRVAEAEAKFVENEAQLAAIQVDHRFVDQLRKDFETYYPKLSRASIHEIFAHSRPRDSKGSYAGASPMAPYYFTRSSRWFSSAIVRGSEDVAGYFKPYPCSNRLRKRYNAKGDVTGVIKPFVPLWKRVRRDTSKCSVFLTVSKDSRGPRTIVKEPLLALKAQLAFFDFMAEGLEKASGRRINFQDQRVNRDLAATSSITREMSTLDLKDASDRVSYDIVKEIFRYSPGLRAFLKRYRTTTVSFKGTVRRLHKLAGMGSGFTFPTMALLAHLSIVRTITNRSSLTYAEAKKIVYVYGDDIIVPSHFFVEAQQALAKVGLMVNHDKSFRLSYFRESCGGDFFKGVDVSPIRLKMSGCDAVSQGSTLVFKKRDSSLYTLERHCRELVKRGMHSLAEYYYQVIERHVGPLPEGLGDTPYMVRVVTDAYPRCDATGTGHPTRAILAVPKVEEHANHCPYHYLGGYLKRNADSEARDGSSFGWATVPRAIRLTVKDILTTDLFVREETEFQKSLRFQGLKHGLIFPTAPF